MSIAAVNLRGYCKYLKSTFYKTISAVSYNFSRKTQINMNDITNIHLTPLESSIYMKPLRFNYTQNGVKKYWDLMTVHDSVTILLFNTDRKKFIFVKQFRPGVYLGRIPSEERNEIDTKKYPVDLGITLELCAGIVDKNKSLPEIAKDEIIEECGYDAPVENIKQVISHCVNVGILTAKQTMFYCEVTDKMKVAEGGGIEDELIEVVELSISDLKQYVSNEYVNSPSGFLFAYQWFLTNKSHHVEK